MTQDGATVIDHNYTLWGRPALIAFSTTPPNPVHGTEDDAGLPSVNLGEGDKLMILTDDNRGELGVSIERIENRQRMINGIMRSYFTADKKSFDIRYEEVPSRREYISESLKNRAVRYVPGSNVRTPQSIEIKKDKQRYYGAGLDMVNWHRATVGKPFWIIVNHDFDIDKEIKHNTQWDFYKVFFADFDYSITKRGGAYDLMSISIQLEEV